MKRRGQINMLLQFSCSNFKSIKEKATISFLSNNDRTYQEELKEFGGRNVLRSLVIYGSNGSGKSNFINALGFMASLVNNSINHQPGQKVLQLPHKLSIDDESTFSVQFVKNEIRYAYGFSIKKGLVEDEYLYYFPNSRKTKVFERTGLEISEGSQFKNKFALSYEALKENRLFLSCAANFSQVKEVENVFLFFKEDIVIYNPEINNWKEFSAELLQNDEIIKGMFIDIMNALGTPIKDIKSVVKQRPISDLPIDAMPEQLKAIMPADTMVNEMDVRLVYDDFEIDLLNEESRGVQKLFEIVCPILDIINNGKILIFDEIETSLHENVVCNILKLFKNTRKDVFAQLLFTTHDTSLLDAKLFRRDQIWFTELDKINRGTELYSLIEIKNVRKSENLKNGYISGRYGGIPVLSDNIYSLLNNVGGDRNV